MHTMDLMSTPATQQGVVGQKAPTRISSIQVPVPAAQREVLGRVAPTSISNSRPYADHIHVTQLCLAMEQIATTRVMPGDGVGLISLHHRLCNLTGQAL